MLQTVESSAERKPEAVLSGYRNEDIIVFEEGLIGFPNCKRFVLMDNEHLRPFKVLQSADQPRVGFLVLDPDIVVKNYNQAIPLAVWDSVGVTDVRDQLSIVISIIGTAPEECSANLQAPLLINFREMKGKQIILTNSRFSVTYPLGQSPKKISARGAAAD